MFVDRRRRGDRFLEWKVGLFSVAAVLALAGIYLDERWVTGVAIVVLAAAMLLRFLPGAGAEDMDEGGDDPGGGQEGGGSEGDAKDLADRGPDERGRDEARGGETA